MAEVFLGKGYEIPKDGFPTEYGWMGYDPKTGKMVEFVSEEDYRETVIFPQIDSEDEEEA